MPFLFTVVTLLVLGLQALLEHPLNLTVVVMPMVRRGFCGRLAGRLLYPGWPAGVCYIMTLLLLLMGAVAFYTYHHYLRLDYDLPMRELVDATVAAGATFGMLPVPLVLWRLFLRRWLPWHLGIYSLLMASVCALAVVIMVAASSTHSNVLKLGLPIPLMGISWMTQTWERFGSNTSGMDGWLSWDYRQIAMFTATSSVMWWLLALVLALRAFRQTRVVEQETAAFLAAGKTHFAS